MKKGIASQIQAECGGKYHLAERTSNRRWYGLRRLAHEPDIYFGPFYSKKAAQMWVDEIHDPLTCECSGQ